MNIITDIAKLNMDKDCAVAIGKFDGFHKGHKLLIDRLKEYEKQGLNSVVFTFDMNPKLFFSNNDYKYIYTRDEKIKYLEEFGIDTLVELPVNEKYMGMEPEQFIEKILVEKLKAREVVVGEDFRFGKDRRGDIRLLEKLGVIYGYNIDAIKKAHDRGLIISSTKIRNEIEVGNLHKAGGLLGRPYSIYGKVVKGNQIGRTINIPTANQIMKEYKCLPPVGVYGSLISIDEKLYEGISNLGYKPTVDSNNSVMGLETYIFDFEGDIYGKYIEVYPIRYVRKEMTFASIKELCEQMENDIKNIKSSIGEIIEEYYELCGVKTGY